MRVARSRSRSRRRSTVHYPHHAGRRDTHTHPRPWISTGEPDVHVRRAVVSHRPRRRAPSPVTSLPAREPQRRDIQDPDTSFPRLQPGGGSPRPPEPWLALAPTRPGSSPVARRGRAANIMCKGPGSTSGGHTRGPGPHNVADSDDATRRPRPSNARALPLPTEPPKGSATRPWPRRRCVHQVSS